MQRSIFNFNLFLYISICLLLHDLPWICSRDAAAWTAPLPWTASGSLATLDSLHHLQHLHFGSQLTWIPSAGLQPLQGPHLHLPIPHRSAGAALWLFHTEDHFEGTSGVVAVFCVRLVSTSYQIGAPCCYLLAATNPQDHWTACSFRTPETYRSITKTITVI